MPDCAVSCRLLVEMDGMGGCGCDGERTGWKRVDGMINGGCGGALGLESRGWQGCEIVALAPGCGDHSKVVGPACATRSSLAS